MRLLLLDFSAAFDTTDHLKLFDCLSSWFSFSNTILAWFKSYMSGRNQFVEVHGSLSSPMPLSFGVPQGSVLGPMVFILYTHPLSKLISSFKNINHHLYADHTQIYITITPENTTTAIQSFSLV